MKNVKEKTKQYLESYLIINKDVLKESEIKELEELIKHYS